MGCRWSSPQEGGGAIGDAPLSSRHHHATPPPLVLSASEESCLRRIKHYSGVNKEGTKTNNNGNTKTKPNKPSNNDNNNNNHFHTSTTTTTPSPSSSSSNLLLDPCYYDKLPRKAQKCKVRSVYDGDTLTLDNQNRDRVRLLGIDTPELKPPQAYSQEAKAYTVNRCFEQPQERQEIWISFEEGHDNEDRYGRLLAWVWVQVPSSSDGNNNSKCLYECVNEGLLREGLASVYTPSKETKLHNMDKLLALQREARESQRGMWRHFRDVVVLIPPNGCAFHHRNGKCEHLKHTKKMNLTQIKTSQAMDEGRHACRTCLAEDDSDNNNNKPTQVSVY